MNQTLAKTYDTRSHVQVVIQASSLAVFMFLSIFGNTLVLVSIRTNQQFREITSVFIASLACADFLVAILDMPFTLVSSITFEWIFGQELCNVAGSINHMFAFASILSLAAVSIERYVAIIKPLNYYTIMTRRRVIGMIIYVWSQSLILALLPLTGWSRFRYLPLDSMCAADWPYSISYVIFMIFINFFIPLSVMTYCYFHILKAAKDHSRRIQPTIVGEISHELPKSIVLSSPVSNNVSEANEQISIQNIEARFEKDKRQKAAAEKKYKQDTKAAKTLLLVMGTFVFCWSPYVIGIMCQTFSECNWPREFFAASTWLGLMNSGCNPIIYGALNRRFRQSFKRILCHCCSYV